MPRRHRWYKRDTLNLLDDLFTRSPFDWVEHSIEMLGSPVSFENSADEDVDGIKAMFQVPGYSKEDLELDYSSHILTVRDKAGDNKEKHRLCLRARLPKNVDPSTIKAECKHGLLTVTAQYREATQDKHIINIG